MKNINLIAETAWHHDGDFLFMKNLVGTILEKSKVDILKVHLTLDFDEYMDRSHPLYEGLGSKLFTRSEWSELFYKTKESGKELMLLYNDTKAIEFGTTFDPSLVEVHSVCLNDVYLLDALKHNINPDTKVVFGIGGSTLEEIDFAIDRIQHEKIVLMYGFQNYPTKYENINFLKFEKIIKKYPDFEFGYADHCAWNEPNNALITLLGALKKGVQYVEKHITTVFGEERTDWQSAISIEMFNEIADKIEILHKCQGSGEMALNEGEEAYRIYGPMKKAGVLIRDVKAGEIYSIEDIEFKRIGDTTDLSQIETINNIGSVYSRDKSAGSTLSSIDFE